jgi:hypothetical protein
MRCFSLEVNEQPCAIGDTATFPKSNIGKDQITTAPIYPFSVSLPVIVGPGLVIKDVKKASCERWKAFERADPCHSV